MEEKIKNVSSDFFRLAKPRRKGILSLIFSRLFIILALLVIQIVIYIGIVGWLEEMLPHYVAAQGCFTLVMLVYLFNNRMDSTAKLTWMFIISLLPIFGSLMLLFTQTNAGHRNITKRTAEVIEQTKEAVAQPEGVLEELAHDGQATDDLVRYLNRSGCFPVFKGSEVTYYPLGEYKFEAMLEELRKAEKYIFMEYFIIEEGYMWGKILEILIEKAKNGVDVRVMYDGMCEISTLPMGYSGLLEKNGIRSMAFSKIMPVLSSHYNYRDHRKILVIDGKTAFTGGVNLADEYINRKERFGHWKDTAIRVRGDAAKSFALMFLQMWNLIQQDEDISPYLEDGGFVPENPNGYVIPYCDSPLDEDKVGETIYIDILNRAESYVHIMTPYLILDGELENALKYAAQRGVDVKLILPGIPDKKVAFALAKSHYSVLLDAGVKIYEYTPGFVHAKVFVSDDRKAVVGTINLDYRSLYHHFECAAYLYKTSCIKDIEADFEDTLSKCRRVTHETVRAEKISYKIMGALMKFVAPLM